MPVKFHNVIKNRFNIQSHGFESLCDLVGLVVMVHLCETPSGCNKGTLSKSLTPYMLNSRFTSALPAQRAINHLMDSFGNYLDVKLAINDHVTLMGTLQWRHNERDGVPHYQPHDCLLSRLFRRRSKKASKLRVTGLCTGNSPATGEFPAQRASNAEYVSIWWRHHET